MIYRIAATRDWEAAQASGYFASADLAAEGFMTRVADKALLLLRMDTNIALARLASGRAVLIGAECRCGVHACPPSSVGERTTRSMSGPPFALQVHLPTVACGATGHATNGYILTFDMTLPLVHLRARQKRYAFSGSSSHGVP